MDKVQTLTSGPIYWFADWPTGSLPSEGAIVYTIWDREFEFVYVGMVGRGRRGGRPKERLRNHASGSRSGDQFCLYVCDRLVLPTVESRLSEVVSGILSLDALTREYIRANLGFRWVSVEDGSVAQELEHYFRLGKGPSGRPLLNRGP